MEESVLSTTKILFAEKFSADELHRIVFYLAEKRANVAVIEDRTPLKFRSDLLDAYGCIEGGVIRLDNVRPDPRIGDIMEMAEALRDKDIDVIVGFGGGSTMDSAKGVAAVLSNGGDLEDYLGPSPSRRLEKHSVKLVLIPTTAGTGAEVTKFGVYTARTGRKYTLNSPLLQADVALLAGSHTYELPPALTAATSFDALSHALEALWNKNATPVSDSAAINSAVAILKVIGGAFAGDRASRDNMLKAACMAGISFNMTGTAACHALSFILSEEWHIPHGAACAFTLEDVCRINMRNGATCVKLARIAESVWGPFADSRAASESLLAAIIALKRDFGLAFTFADLGVAADVERLCGLFDKSLDDPKMQNNIVPFDRGVIRDIITDKCR